MRRKIEEIKDKAITWLIHKLGGKTAWEYRVATYCRTTSANVKGVETYSSQLYLSYEEIEKGDLSVTREILIESLYERLMNELRLNNCIEFHTKTDAYGETLTAEVKVIK